MYDYFCHISGTIFSEQYRKHGKDQQAAVTISKSFFREMGYAMLPQDEFPLRTTRVPCQISKTRQMLTVFKKN
ncbi:MAG: hypothetical protein LBK82_02510, partial [Planctomycetaceae bacterium]|nr:hypothetical protein [Planctomycetaceae bacterium]